MSDAEQKRQFDNQCWSVAPSEAPCRQACPIGTDTSGYIMAIYMGDLNEAYRILSRNNALPGVCGRVCHFPCENECVRTKVEQPVAIRALKRFVVEQASEEVKNEVPLCTKKKCQKVAVIGSGPAGLAAAHSLIRKGYHVTVFERTQRVDGLLTSAIPGFILPSAVLAEDLGRLAFMGVEFVTGMSIQGKPGADKLMAGGYSAVVLTIGASGATLLPQIPYDNDNLVPGLLFLQEMIKSPDASLSRKVVVIGGGNVATDAARLCVRRGARKVRIYAIEEKDAMPAFGHELEQCEAEGVDINGGWGISKVEEKEDGLSIVLSKVTRILTTDGGIRPIFDSRQSHEYKADHLIVAVGQKVEADVLEGLGAVFSPNGTVVADDTLLGAAGVFVAGDV
ncbi:MAG: FAD-dependent oxidoreductase, partial [Desulfatitalea sp.]|nr:FAD-dependent oxidoreductase [Desulfatitalea sp.]NNK02345.1 FAD-dependent oxidoreductase [Desulfatitalea sp.]